MGFGVTLAQTPLRTNHEPPSVSGVRPLGSRQALGAVGMFAGVSICYAGCCVDVYLAPTPIFYIVPGIAGRKFVAHLIPKGKGCRGMYCEQCAPIFMGSTKAS